jgi:hypothetical protein
MENKQNIRMIRGIGYYLPKAMKFYNLKTEYLTPLIFTISLIFYFISGYFVYKLFPDVMGTLNNLISMPNSQITNLGWYMTISIITTFLVSTFASVFLIACIKELKGEEYTIKKGFKLLSGKFYKIAFSSLLFSFAYNILLKVFFVIPGFIYYSIYLFYMCYAIDMKKRSADAFETSKIITKGHRMEIFSVVILFKIVSFISVNFIVLFVLSFITSILSITNNSLVEVFVSAFMSTIIYLMETKLVALIYFDLEYGWKPVEK